jgi:hypothetical protein
MELLLITTITTITTHYSPGQLGDAEEKPGLSEEEVCKLLESEKSAGKSEPCSVAILARQAEVTHQQKHIAQAQQ